MLGIIPFVVGVCQRRITQETSGYRKEGMGEMEIRTDLALESREGVASSLDVKRDVICSSVEKLQGIKVSTVEITSEKAQKLMGKPMGTYVTIEGQPVTEKEESYGELLSKELSLVLEKLLTKYKVSSALVVGLGNRMVTPDALGPRTLDYLDINRHLDEEYPITVSAIVPGVMAQTGMETAEIVQGIVKETKPELVVVVDALAARNAKRLGCTIQLSDTGICPGSGVGNHRNAINKETLGVHVISIGVPTVIDARTIVSDAVGDFHGKHEERYEELSRWFVTPKDIDESIQLLSRILADGINRAFSGNKTS